MKILSGAIQPDRGSMNLGGGALTLPADHVRRYRGVWR